jgi:hypothetical protein
LRECFTNQEQCGGEYQVEFAYSVNQVLEKLMSFKPDIALINFDSFYETPCGQIASRITESPYKPREVIVFGLNLEAGDKQRLEQLGIQYVDQRKSFSKLMIAVRQATLARDSHED